MSTQYSQGGETRTGANLGAGGSEMTSDADSNSGRGGATSGGGAQSSAADSTLNLGSARSDYGDRAYGGSLDAQGLGGSYVDDFSKGRELVGLGGEGARRSRRGDRRRGYSFGGTGTGITLLAGMTIGATLMYIFDPDQGRRRRALLRDQIVSCMNQTGDILGKTSRDLRNRAQGVVAETSKTLGLRGSQGEGSNAVGGAASRPDGQQSSAGA